MATDVRTDAKAGFCNWCRQGDHAVCASVMCKCTQVAHRNRPKPGADGPAARRNGGGSTPSAQRPADDDNPLADVRRRANGAASRPPKAKPTEPVWELVKADPPAPPEKPRRLTVVEKARPLLEQLMAEDLRDWHRIAVFPSSMAAGQTKGRLARRYREFDFRAVRVPEISQSAIYVRWVGKREAQL